MRNTRYSFTALIVGLLSVSEITGAFSSASVGMAKTSSLTPRMRESLGQQHGGSRLASSLNMQQPGRKEDIQKPLSLSAYTVELDDYETSAIRDMKPSLLESFVLPVSMAALMVTGNTVGAGMLVLPEVAAGPGPMFSFGVMIGAWMMCLMSGLTIAQVAIQGHESSGSEVPSSFKEFAEATLPSAANMVSGTSVFINTLVVAFDVFKAGQIGTTLLPSDFSSIDGTTLSCIYSVLLVLLVATQPLKNLSKVASTLVLGLFGTFAGLLLPGLANLQNPIALLSLPPVLPTEEISNGLLHMTPVVVSVLVFQNIVPTITRFLDYDRVKVGTALTVGSFIPLIMYMAWTITVLGGGITASSTSGNALGALMTCFSLITVAGSSLGGSMSLSEEFETWIGDSSAEVVERDNTSKDSTFSLQSVATPIGIALIIAQIFSSDITETLKIAGAFGSPILYGLIPVSMALMQQKQANKNGNFGAEGSEGIIPGGIVGLGALATGSVALISAEAVQTCASLGAL